MVLLSFSTYANTEEALKGAFFSGDEDLGELIFTYSSPPYTQVAACRPDLRDGQPRFGPGRHLRSFCGALGGQRQAAQARPRS
jgi:hypothetical protein